MKKKYSNNEKIDYFDMWQKNNNDSKVMYRDLEISQKPIARRVQAKVIETEEMKNRREELVSHKRIIKSLHKTRSIDIQKGAYGSDQGRREELIHIKKVLKEEIDTRSLYSY